MLTAEARVATERASRYLVQLCRHASQMGPHGGIGQRLRHRPRIPGSGDGPPDIRHAEWSDTSGTVILPWGKWTAQAAAGTLTLRAEADTEEHLRRIQDGISARLEKIGRRDHLTVTWHRSAAPAVPPAETCPADGRGPDAARAPENEDST